MDEHRTTITATAPAVGGPGRTQRFLTRVHPTASAPHAVKGRLVVGRSVGNKGISCDDTRMSRAHFELRPASSGGALRFEDQGTKNGTRVDGRPAQKTYVGDGALIRAGDTLFVVEDRRPPAKMAPTAAGCSIAMDWAQQIVDRVATEPLTVLIRGPSGAGKERLAERLHAHSGRSGAFVPVNCTTLPEHLVASELFGHVRGAFSGAEARSGLFAAAAGGTLFLDEIGDLPLAQQPLFLRALQERRVRPVGAEREIEVDVRILAATHQDLEAAVAQGRFRPDLLARLSEFEIEMPGLAERRVDVLPLFRALVGAEVTADAAEALLLNDWVNNVRDLQKLAARIRVFTGGQGPVELSMLPTAMQARVETPAPAEFEVARAELERLLQIHRGNVSRVARALGATRQRIYRRLEALDIEARSFR